MNERTRVGREQKKDRLFRFFLKKNRRNRQRVSILDVYLANN